MKDTETLKVSKRGLSESHRPRRILRRIGAVLAGLLAVIILSLGGRYDQALEQARKTIEIDPTSGSAHTGLGMAYERKRQFAEAIAAMEKAHSLDSSPWLSGFRGYVYAAAGKKAEAEKVLAELKELSKRQYVPAYNVAFIYAGLNDKDQAFDWLNKGREAHSGLSVMKVEPALDNLRSDPRYKELLKRLNLPQ
jgi:tetratricopeptide (TPR) repeat protein